METINKSRHLPTKHSTSQEDHFKPYIPAAEQQGILEGALDKTKLLKSGAGFTLVELLVVIAIISLLASVVLVALNGARAKARDASRKADLTQFTKALELYYSKYGQYPENATTSCGSIYWSLSNACSDFIPGIKEFANYPQAPGNSYFQYSSRSAANGGDNWQSYKIFVTGAETEQISGDSQWAECPSGCATTNPGSWCALNPTPANSTDYSLGNGFALCFY